MSADAERADRDVGPRCRACGVRLRLVVPYQHPRSTDETARCPDANLILYRHPHDLEDGAAGGGGGGATNLTHPVEVITNLNKASDHLSAAHQWAGEQEGAQADLIGPVRDLIFGLNSAVEALELLLKENHHAHCKAEEKSKLKLWCSICERCVGTYVPAQGDGSGRFPRRHNNREGQACSGHFEFALWNDPAPPRGERAAGDAGAERPGGAEAGGDAAPGAGVRGTALRPRLFGYVDFDDDGEEVR